MNKLDSNPILEFNPNQMNEVRELFGYDDLNRLYQDIKLLEDWIKMQHHFIVKEYEKEYLERYLINSKGSIERAKKRLDKLCTLRGLMPEYLTGLDIENEFRNYMKVSYLCVLPKPTRDHCRLVYYTVHNSDAPEYVEHISISRYLLMMLQYLYYHDYNAGIQIIADTRKMSFGVVTKYSPIIIANTMMIITEALGLRLRGFHFLSGSTFIDTFMTIVKKGMTKKLQSRLHVHEDYTSMYNVIPKDILPKDVGGDLPSVKEINEKNFKEYSSPKFINKMKFLESAGTNEKKRLSSKFNEEYSGMPGSFKVLSVD